MKTIPLLALSSLLALAPQLNATPDLRAAAPAGKTQPLTAPGQLPQGLAKSDWASIRATYEAGRHAFQPVPGRDGVWQARNPGQQWLTQFDGRGFLAEPNGGGWQWGLELKRYGFPGAERVIHGVSAVKAGGQRLTYAWDAAVQEWFVNDPRGLEHGFTLQERPTTNPSLNPQPSTLNFVFAVRGSLVAKVAADGQGLLFCDASGATVITYSGLKVTDADGKMLPARFVSLNSQLSTLNPAIPSLVTLLVDERGARYPLTIDPIAQQAYLKASNTGASDQFGQSVAVSGDTVVVGADGESSAATGVNGNQGDNSASYAGAAYVFVRSGTTWTQQAYLKASNTGADDYFGTVAVSGDTVVVGAYYEASAATGVNGNQGDDSASAAGAAYVFVRSGTTWSQQAYLKASNTEAGDEFGRSSVAVSGDTVVIRARLEDSAATGVNGNQSDNSAVNSGAAYVFTCSHRVALDSDGSGGYFIRYDGFPGYSYRLLRAASLSGPWPAIDTNTAPSSDLLEFHDTSPLPGRGFYRVSFGD